MFKISNICLHCHHEKTPTPANPKYLEKVESRSLLTNMYSRMSLLSKKNKSILICRDNLTL